jgi:hypothetical protein
LIKVGTEYSEVRGSSANSESRSEHLNRKKLAPPSRKVSAGEIIDRMCLMGAARLQPEPYSRTHSIFRYGALSHGQDENSLAETSTLA